MDSLGAKKLYVKFFDVDWDAARNRPVPLAEVQVDTTNIYGLEIVPTVFITNRTFLNLNESPRLLSEKIINKINKIGQNKFGSIFREIQMDCDWTESTREKYFHFLKLIQVENSPFAIRHSPFQLSATIRLHQYKYPEKTGIPPVDRGMLMAYNIGEVDKWETDNSILDLDILDQYVGSRQLAVGSRQLAVPSSQSAVPSSQLPLDLALPIFRWGVVFRENVSDENKWEMAYLINGLGAEGLADTARFAKLETARYEVRKNTYLEGYYLYAGDRVRLESVSPELLEKAAGRIDNFSKVVNSNDPMTISFYHLDTSTLKFFDHEKLERILEKF